MEYFDVVLVAGLLSIICTEIVRRAALKFDITDKPGAARKIHTHPIPLLGGIGVIASVILTLAVYQGISGFIPGTPHLTDWSITPLMLFGVGLGALILAIGGALDDRFNLAPHIQIFFPLAAACAVVAAGIRIDVVTNPFGAALHLDAISSSLLTIAWLLVVTYTTKFLDGLDGLVAGVTAIGSLLIGLFSIFFFVNIPTALLACAVAGSFAGFLVFNFHPARMFLGEAGSTFAGYMLGILSIISGAKLAVAFLILGFPILDAAWVIARRMFIERRSPFRADRTHLHFRLLDAGFSQRQSALILYALAAFFGCSALFLQTSQKLIAAGALVSTMVILGIFLLRRSKRSRL